MTITAVCTSCGRSFKAPEQFAGKRVKCKNCGIVFQIPSSTPAVNDQDTELGTLEQLERTAGGTEIASTTPPPSKPKIGPKLEKKLEANPDAAEIPLSGPTEISGRANVMPFRYPGARQIDQWLPLGLLLMGLIGVAAVVAGVKDTNDLTWISFSRFAIVVFFYLVLIFPITLSMLKKAAAEMRYRLPPNFKMRTFGIYMPAFALTTCFWLAGNGSVLGLILGLLFGLALSSAALWLLFRLRESELATSVSYGAGGFVLGAGISIALILGLNALTLLIVTKSKAEAKVPTSPFSPGLAWVAPPPPVVHIVKKPAPAVTVPEANTVPSPTSPVVSDLQTDKIPFPVDAIIRPLSPSPIVGVLHTVDNFSLVEPWNTQTMQRESGSELRVSPEPGAPAEYQISTDGKRVAWIAQQPRLSVKVWSFDNNQAEMRVLGKSLGTPRLLGFFTPHTVLIRWGPAVDPADTKPPVVKPYTIQVLDTDTTTSDVKTFDTLPMADSPPSLAVNVKTHRLAAAGVDIANPTNPVSTLIQYDLLTRKPVQTITIDEVDPSAPAGVAYSADGQHLAVLFEYTGGALLLDYDAKTGTKLHDFVYTVWPPAGISTEPFKSKKESAIAWLDSTNLLLYGQGIVDSKTGTVVANLAVPGVAAQRALDENDVELLTSDAKRITLARLDREKLNALINPPVPTPAP